jgi:hypothetical protein
MVLGQTGGVPNTQLVGDVGHYITGNISGIRQEGAQKSHRSKLHSEPQTAMVSAAVLNQRVISVIEMKIPCQLGWRWVFGIAPIAALLVLGQELNRHIPPSLSVKVSAKQNDHGLLPYTKSVGENCPPPFWGTIA